MWDGWIPFALIWALGVLMVGGLLSGPWLTLALLSLVGPISILGWVALSSEPSSARSSAGSSGPPRSDGGTSSSGASRQ